MSTIKIENITINCADQSELAATLYRPEKPKAAIMIAPATGIKRQFYNSFATFLAEQGFGVITYDNQGIAESANGGAKNSKATLVTWGQVDMSAVFARLKAEFPNTDYHLVGHSAGGQLVGLMDGAMELTSIFNFACSSGSLRNMKMPFWFAANFFMSVFIPLNNLIFGYSNSQWVGMGEPLPRYVAQQWADWCNSTGYIKDYLDNNKFTHHYLELSCPAMWLNATDDTIANNTNVADMVRVFPNLKNEIVTLNPADYKLKEIGHMKFFSKRNSVLWEIALKWFEDNKS